ncbi:MAG: hypothetical protein ACPGO3_09975 [Magnetospiraceae bacterium]
MLESAMGHVAVSHLYRVECVGRDGALKWAEETPNIVVNEGLNDFLDKYYKGSGYTAAHYVGLKGTGTPAAADTMASHASWSEVTPYSDAARQALTMGTVSDQSVDNAAAKAVFNINATATVYGAFVTTDSTKGGTSGTLVGAADFSASRNVESGDTLNITITATTASA